MLPIRRPCELSSWRYDYRTVNENKLVRWFYLTLTTKIQGSAIFQVLDQSHRIGPKLEVWHFLVFL